MMDAAVYIVTKEIAERSGMIGSRYRIPDGRYILNNRDLSMIRFTTDEFINGLQGVTKTTQAEADSLIAANNYTIGAETETNEEQTPDNNDEQEENN